MTLQHPVVLFDLDGTISDNSVGITNGIVRALAHFGITIDPSEAGQYIGPPLRVVFPQLGVDPARVEDAVSVYRQYYDHIGWAENVLYDGVAAVLRALVASGRTVATATSKPDVSARRILEHFGLAENFQYIGAATLDGRRDHKHEVVAHTLEVLGVDPDDAVMVGDRSHDVEGARMAGVGACIGVTWGFALPGELEAAGASPIVADAGQLARALSVELS